MPKKIEYKEAVKRFIDGGKTDVMLCEDGYNGWQEISKLYDVEIQDYFWSRPDTVFKLNINHPTKSNIKRKRTCKERYGVEDVNQLPEVRQKIKQTCLEKYDCEYATQSKVVQDKIKQTCLEKYDCESVLQSEMVKDKIKQTCLERYDCENPSQNEEIKQKKRETTYKNHGVENPFDSIEIKNKIKQTNKKKYGVENPYQIKHIKEKASKSVIKHVVFESGESVRQWLIKQPSPKPSIHYMISQFNKREQISLSELEDYCKNYKEHKNRLEVFAEVLFNTTHYNKKAQGLSNTAKKWYKPDFKLSDTTYLNTDGAYWHSAEKKGVDYHYNLREDFEKNGLMIFQFFEDEIYHKTDIIKSIVNRYLGKNDVVLDLCDKDVCIKEVFFMEAAIFLKQNHMIGNVEHKSINHIGLYHNNVLLSLLSYRLQEESCVIERFCIKNGYHFVELDVLSKMTDTLLLKHTETLINRFYIYYDLRYEFAPKMPSRGLLGSANGMFYGSHGWDFVGDYKNEYLSDGKVTYTNLDNVDFDNIEEDMFIVYGAGRRVFVREVV